MTNPGNPTQRIIMRIGLASLQIRSSLTPGDTANLEMLRAIVIAQRPGHIEVRLAVRTVCPTSPWFQRACRCRSPRPHWPSLRQPLNNEPGKQRKSKARNEHETHTLLTGSTKAGTPAKRLGIVSHQTFTPRIIVAPDGSLCFWAPRSIQFGSHVVDRWTN